MRPSTRPRTGLVLALLAATALAGCGRRGPLELPPGTPTAKAPAAQQPDDHPEDSAAFKNPVFKEAPAPRPINGPPAAKPNGFFLDPVL